MEYKLLAVVRLGDKNTGTQDRIRVYNSDYSEIRTKFMSTEKEDSVRQPRGWSTSQDGSYLLIYWRVRGPENRDGIRQRRPDGPWPAIYLEKRVPEYDPRDCHGNEIQMEQLPAASLAASSPSSSDVLSANDDSNDLVLAPEEMRFDEEERNSAAASDQLRTEQGIWLALTSSFQALE